MLGPHVTPARFAPRPDKLQFRLSLNGEIKQDGGTDDLIFNVAWLVEFLSTHAALLPGDVIMTGSPAGNGTRHNRLLRDGDVVTEESPGSWADRPPLARRSSRERTRPRPVCASA